MFNSISVSVQEFQISLCVFLAILIVIHTYSYQRLKEIHKNDHYRLNGVTNNGE